MMEYMLRKNEIITIYAEKKWNNSNKITNLYAITNIVCNIEYFSNKILASNHSSYKNNKLGNLVLI